MLDYYLDKGKDIPQLIVPACNLEDIGSHSVVISLYSAPETVYVKLPKELTEFSLLEEVKCIEGDNQDVPEECSRIENVPWIDIPLSAFGTAPGKQTYSLKFKNSQDQHYLLYFSVIIQNDNPDKPYIYMKRDEQ